MGTLELDSRVSGVGCLSAGVRLGNRVSPLGSDRRRWRSTVRLCRKIGVGEIIAFIERRRDQRA
jgi:hypothetical protein